MKNSCEELKKASEELKKSHGARKIELCSIFLPFSVTFPLEFYLKFNSLSNALYFRALAPILTELWPFSHYNFLKREFFGFFSSYRPPYKSQIIKISKNYCLQSIMWIFASRKLLKIVPEYLLRYSK